MAHRVFNFNPGPSTLPLSVLETIQAELLDYRGSGMSVMELSHRSPEFDEIMNSAIALTREIFDLPERYHRECCLLFLESAHQHASGQGRLPGTGVRHVA